MHLIINDPETGKSYKLEIDEEKAKLLYGKRIGDKVDGSLFGLNGYILEIRGGSNNAGFPMVPYVEGTGLKRVLIPMGVPGFRKRRRRKKVKGHRKRGVKWNHKALRLRKTVRGNVIDKDIVQLNLKIIKKGEISIEEIIKQNQQSQ